MSGQVTFESLLHRCIITHEPWHEINYESLEDKQVQAAYLIGEKPLRETRDRLERMWCIPKGYLRLNSAMNILPLRADWHEGIDNVEWILLPQCSQLDAILNALKGGLEEAAKLFPWTKDGKSFYQRFTYMFISLDDASRTFPIGTRKIEEGRTIVTQDVTDHEIGLLDASSGTLVHSLAHPFPVIWKAVEMFGVDTLPRSRLSNNPPDHRTTMATAQMIYSTWDRLLRGEDALNKARRNDGQNIPITGKRKRDDTDESDPTSLDDHDDTFVDAGVGSCKTSPQHIAFDIPDDAPTFVSDAHVEIPQKKYSKVRDEDRPIPLYLAPRSGPMADMLDNYGLDDAEREKIHRERRAKIRRLDTEAFLDRWFKNDFKPEIGDSLDCDTAVSPTCDIDQGPSLVN